MLASVSLLGEQGVDVINIPRSAFIRGGAKDRVVVALGEGRFAHTARRRRTESGDRVTIRQGLAEGERVVVAAQFLLDSEANLARGPRPAAGRRQAPKNRPGHAAPRPIRTRPLEARQ